MKIHFQLTQENIIKIIRHLSDIHFISVYYFINQELRKAQHPYNLKQDFSIFSQDSSFIDQIFSFSEKNYFFYHEAENDKIYYGVLKYPDGYQFIIGPLASGKLSSIEINKYLNSHFLKSDSSYIIPDIKEERCFQIMSFLNFLLTEEIMPEDFINTDNSSGHISDTETVNNLVQYKYEKMDELPHFPFFITQKVLSCISEGNFQGANDMLQEVNRYSRGKMSDSPMKEKEYEAASSVTIWSIVASYCGVNPYDVYDMNDIYLQKISHSHSIKEYNHIIQDALFTICLMIKRAKADKARNIIIEKVKNYIARNLNKELTLPIIAQHIGVSASYLSNTFSKQEGITLMQYIIRERLNASSNMLKYSDYTISEISSYLNFSSQSYFGYLFKKRFGLSPSAFREKYFVIP